MYLFLDEFLAVVSVCREEFEVNVVGVLVLIEEYAALVCLDVFHEVHHDVVGELGDVLGVVAQDFCKERLTLRGPVSLDILRLAFLFLAVGVLERFTHVQQRVAEHVLVGEWLVVAGEVALSDGVCEV